MDIYNLNFKKVLVVLNHKDLRSALVKALNKNEIDANITFVDSYSEAAKIVDREKFNQFDFIILDQQFSNRKLKDFLDYVHSIVNVGDVLDISHLVG